MSPQGSVLEGAVAVAQGQLLRPHLQDAVGRVHHADPLEVVEERVTVGAGVVNDGAAQGAGDAAGPLQAGVAGEGEAAGESGQADAAGGPHFGAGAVGDGALHLVGGVLDDETANAAVQDDDVGAGTQDGHRDVVLAGGSQGGTQVLLRAGGEVDVGGPADADGGVAGERLVQEDGPQRSQFG